MRIYAASLSDYNGGILHGVWVDVTDKATMWDEINAMLAASPTAKSEGCPAEEWAMHDYELEGLNLSTEHPDLDELVAIKDAYEEHGEPYLQWVAHDPQYNTDPSDFQDQFRGEWDSLADYVQDFWEQSGWKEEGEWYHPSHYVDWERLAHDWEVNGDVYTIEHDSKVLIFSNN